MHIVHLQYSIVIFSQNFQRKRIVLELHFVLWVGSLFGRPRHWNRYFIPLILCVIQLRAKMIITLFSYKLFDWIFSGEKSKLIHHWSTWQLLAATAAKVSSIYDDTLFLCAYHRTTPLNYFSVRLSLVPRQWRQRGGGWGNVRAHATEDSINRELLSVFVVFRLVLERGLEGGGN